jgi:hypothetical protein
MIFSIKNDINIKMTSNINSSQNDQDDMNIYITPTGEKQYFNNKNQLCISNA